MNISRPNMKYQLIAKDIHNDDKVRMHQGRRRLKGLGGNISRKLYRYITVQNQEIGSRPTPRHTMPKCNPQLLETKILEGWEYAQCYNKNISVVGFDHYGFAAFLCDMFATYNDVAFSFLMETFV
ncbi:unnamed protein product [Boreogadus saida]